MGVLQRIRQRISQKDYYLSSHAEEEMWADGLERTDVEHAILNGSIEKKLTRDFRGTRYRIEGPAVDGRLVHVVCRFNMAGELLVVTVYVL